MDLLLREGWTVRILDNLEPQTHKHGKPEWVNPAAEFRLGFVQDYETMRAALEDIDVVFHEAAYGGYMPEMAKYVLVNSFGTAQMLEIIRDHKLPVKKVVVASSQAVYSEGAANCPEHGHVVPLLRPAEQLREWRLCRALPRAGCGTSMRQADDVDSDAGSDAGRRRNRVRADQGGPGTAGAVVGQADRHPDRGAALLLYLRAAAIVVQPVYRGDCDLLHAAAEHQPPVMYEDGGQTRDLCFVEDIARANLLVATTDKLDGLPVNAGSGRATSVRDLAGIIANQLGVELQPLARGEFRPGEIRSLISDISRIRTIGYEPQVTIEQGIARYIDWIGTQGTVDDYFSKAEAGLRAKGIVQSVNA